MTSANRITGVTQGTTAVSFSYDAASRRTSATLPNGVTVAYGYDDGNQLTSLVYQRNGTMIGDLTYSYDSAGRRTGMGGTLANVNLPPSLTSATYDANNRLTNWGGTNYDYGYDDNGNLTSDGTRTYTWDVRDRLTGLNGGGITSSYGYDAFNRRTTKTINSVQIGTLYDGFSEVHTTSGSTITSTLLNGQGLDERYARTQGGSTETFLTDALGSTLNLVNASGALTANYVYEPYGQTSQSGSSDTQYRYTGREDDGTGLMYYRARYYNPRTSRFISEDPIGLAGGYNLYGYVGASPTAFSDPSGLYGGDWHSIMSRAAFAKFPCFPKDYVEAVARGSQDVDYKSGSQDASNSYMHAMRDGVSGQSRASAEQAFNDYVSRSIDSGSVGGFAGAMHAVQDQTASGHADFAPWQGGIWPGFSHLIGDLFPSHADWNASVAASESVIAAWIARHGCKCKQ